MTATAPGGARYTVVSADGHAGGDIQDYRPYLASRWHEEFDAWAAEYVNPFADLLAPIAYRNWDSARRLAETESDGIAAEVLFPNTVPPFFSEGNLVALPPTPEDYERRWAGVQAHNRWLADFCAATPGRRAGIIQVFANDMADAVEEVRWAASTFDPFGGILLPSIPPNSPLPPLWEDHYEPLWQVCADLDVPINIHGGTALPDYGEHEAARSMMLIEIPWFSHRSVWHLIFSGVLERHPTLRFVVTEQGVAWLPRGLETLDWFYGRMTMANAAEAKFFGAGAAKMTMTPDRVLRPQLLDRGQLPAPERGAPVPRPRDRPRHVGGGLPALRGQLPVHDRGAPGGVRRLRRARGAGHGGVDGGVLLRVRPRPAAADRRPRRPAGGGGRPAAGARELADHDDLQRVRPHADPACLVSREGGHMTTVRYGARAAQVNHEIEAKKADIWSEAVTAIYETDPEIIAAILPPPLEPGPEPLVRITITRVEMPGLPIFGAGWIGVQARHGDRLGEYPILMPMTTEQSLIGGREINGEPKKLAEVEVTRDGAHVSAHIARMGSVICEITGTVTGTRDNYEMEKTDFWLKLSPSCEEAGVLDQDPLLVYGEKTERTRLHESIEGELILKEAPLDPIADLVVRRMVDLNWTERASTQVGRVIGPVPRAGVEPFIHQRYDDLSVLGAKR